MTEIDVLVIGGGISGLSVAHLLAKAGIACELWEQDSNAGGKIKSDNKGGYLTERAASMVMNFRPEVQTFITNADLDWCKSEMAQTTCRYLVQNGELVQLPMKLGGLVGSHLWSSRGKLRLLTEPFIAKGGNENETVSQFIKRRLGRELLEKAMEPYIGGPLAADVDRANAYATLPRLTALERKYGSLTLGVLAHRLLRKRSAAVTETFSFQGGMSDLINTIKQTPNINFRPNYTAIALEPSGAGWVASAETSAGSHSMRARHIVLSTPGGISANLVASLDDELSKLLGGIQYAPVSVVHMGFDRDAVKHKLNGTGFLIPRGESLATTGCMWMSTLFAGRAPRGNVLLSCYVGGARQPQVADWNDDQIIDTALNDISPLLGINNDPEMVGIDRHRQGLPLYHGAYYKRVRDIENCLRGLPGIHLAANFLHGVSVRDRIYCATQLVEQLLPKLDPSLKVVEEKVRSSTLTRSPPHFNY